MLERATLEALLAEGGSLEEIGRRVSCHPSTVSYWLKKYGLAAAHRERHASRGGIDRGILSRLIGEGMSSHAMAKRLGLSQATVRHWLDVYDLETWGTVRRRALAAARETGLPEVVIECQHCGPATHRLASDGGFVCLRCRASAVVRRRRKVKATLVAEAGGSCVLCGYDTSLAALQFHHVDPSAKKFHISHRGLSRSMQRAREEASKCVLLCANCHAAVECGDAAVP